MGETRIRVSDTVTVVEETDLDGEHVVMRRCYIEIECDDRTGAGYALEKIAAVLPQAVPHDWLQVMQQGGLIGG